MEYFNPKDDENIYKILKQNILSIPGVASIAKNKDDNLIIDISKSDVGWTVDISINCFSYVNIWAVTKQVQNQAKYVIEKINKYKETIEINVNVFDLIAENFN